MDFPRELEFVFSSGFGRTYLPTYLVPAGRATCAQSIPGKATLDGTAAFLPVPLSLRVPLTRFSLFRESAESYFMSRELRRACPVTKL